MTVINNENEYEFLAAIDYELNRCKRYGGSFSIIVLETFNLMAGIRHNSDYEKHCKEMSNALFRVLRTGLRATDNVLPVSEISAGIVLPFTCEAAADAVAMRLKKMIASKVRNKNLESVASCSGVCSNQEKENAVSSRLYELAKQELNLERKVQRLFPESLDEIIQTDEAGGVLILTYRPEKYENVIKELLEYGYSVFLTKNSEDILNIACRKKYFLVLVDIKKSSEEKGGVPNIISSVKERERESCLFTGIDETDMFIFDSFLPSNISDEIIVRHVKREMEYLTLKHQTLMCYQMQKTLVSIRAMTHQIGQPLQVMLGNAELLSMKLKSFEQCTQNINNIKSSVFEISEMNAKVSRLAKMQ